jgi:DNA-binding LacI/PurR family transcriptional regulator
MAKLMFKSKIEQVAEHLRDEMARGRWNREIPGREELASDLGVNSKTVESALKLLEHKGVLIPQGVGRRRKISEHVDHALPALHIRLFLYEPADRSLISTVETIHELSTLGHVVSVSEKSLQELGLSLARVANYVAKNPADAWVVIGGPRDILEWFAEQNFPVFAQYGRSRDIGISGVKVNKVPALTEAVRKLTSLGHRRIVMLARSERRKPNPGLLEQEFLNELERNGIKTGPYHLPEWDDDLEGFHRCLDALFTTTPPTAIILSEAEHMIAAQQHLAMKGIVAPRDISLICQDPSHAFSWCIPRISHIYWDAKPVVNSILQWANRIARGKDGRKQMIVNAEFVEGETIGPVA